MKRYDLFIEPEAHKARKRLPGNAPQLIKKTIEALAEDPRPPKSHSLDVTGIDVPPGVELRRLRIPPWRIVYAVSDDERWVWVLGLRHRPPYDYGDLHDLISRLR